MSFKQAKSSRTAVQPVTPRVRASTGEQAKGGSVYIKEKAGIIHAVCSIVSAFVKKHKLDKFHHVNIFLNEKTKVMALEFLKEKGDGSFAIEHDAGGTMFIRITPALRAFGLKLTSDLIDEEYVFDKDGLMIIDLSDNVGKLTKDEGAVRQTAFVADAE